MMNTKQRFVVGLDIGGTHVRVGSVAEDYSLSFFQKEKTAVVLGNQDPIQSLIYFIKHYIEDTIGYQQAAAISIGFPSIVSKDKKILLSTPNLENLDNINVVEPLEEFFGIPVHIDNDVNFLLQYEITKRAIGNEDIVLGFYIGTGFGNSIYLNNSFLSGKNGAAGELGHIPVLGSEVICQCGNVGCIEMFASGKYLVNLHKNYLSNVNFEEIFTHYSEHEQVKSYIRALAVPIATEINIFDPDLVILGGGVVGMVDFPKRLLEKEIIKYSRKPYPANNLQIEYAEDTNAAGVIGGAAAAFEKLIKRNKVNN